MIQFYLVSVILNIVGGYSLCPDASATRGSSFDGVRAFLRERTTRVVVGILAAVTGAFKLLNAVRGDIPVVGDFLPAMAGLAVGSTLLLERFRDPEFAAPSGRHPGTGPEAAVESEGAARQAAASGAEPAAAAPQGKPEARKGLGKVERFLLDHKTAVGLAGIIAAGVHFLFPMVLFL